MKKILGFVVIASLAMYACLSQAVTVTNQGQVITITTLDGVADAGTATADQSTYATPTARDGLIVAHCAITESSTSVDFGSTVPKGSILLEDAVIEVATAVNPATATNSIAVGGITVLAAGVTLNSTGIKQAVATPGITTSADKLTLSITGSAATSGVFTVYLPYVLGNAGR